MTDTERIIIRLDTLIDKIDKIWEEYKQILMARLEAEKKAYDKINGREEEE